MGRAKTASGRLDLNTAALLRDQNNGYRDNFVSSFPPFVNFHNGSSHQIDRGE
jgi:hypothetical protein